MVVVSIVSHGHGIMLEDLVSNLINCHEISKIIITFNISEKNINLPSNNKIVIINNSHSKGFGENHNAAFKLSHDKYFCILNPDVKLTANPFSALIKCFYSDNIKLLAPIVLDNEGFVEDSIRYYPNMFSLLCKLFFKIEGRFPLIVNSNDNLIYPDWVAGMFMLFESNSYKTIQGFDESFFMYYEDVDICKRLQLHGYKLAVDPNTFIIHNAQRDSHKKINYFFWHIRSMFRYLWRYK